MASALSYSQSSEGDGPLPTIPSDQRAQTLNPGWGSGGQEGFPESKVERRVGIGVQHVHRYEDPEQGWLRRALNAKLLQRLWLCPNIHSPFNTNEIWLLGRKTTFPSLP